jgi:molybdopterin converting factor subunit 1
MKISVSFFAQSREIAGHSQMEFEIRDGEDVANLLKRLQSQFPEFAGIPIMVAVNTEYADKSHLLRDGDNVAIIPPINGG